MKPKLCRFFTGHQYPSAYSNILIDLLGTGVLVPNNNINWAFSLNLTNLFINPQ